MDTVTQMTLGAAIGEGMLGKKTGYKGAAWGAFLGIIPDLDILANPFVNEVQELAIHRGISHSLLLSVLLPPLIGWGLSRLHPGGKAGWHSWSVMAFLVYITHIFIDLCTSYGTQILQPFSNASLSLNSIFIIDPFYTFPLLGGLLVALFLRRRSPGRQWANYLGLAASSIYLLSGLAVKAYVNSVFEENLERSEIRADRFMTTPAPFSVFLWNGYIESGDTVYAGTYSVFDNDDMIEFKGIPRHADLIEPYRDDRAVERIIWFSNGYYAAERSGGRLLVHDLRFGRSDLWLTRRDAPFVWSYRLEFNSDSTRVTGFHRIRPAFETSNGLPGMLIDRAFGVE